MKRSHSILLLTLKLVLVALLIAWIYSRAETEMRGERANVVAARGTLTVAAPGGPADIEMEQSRAAELYDLVREGSWTRGGSDAPRGTVEIIYDTDARDRIEITGPDRVSINGTTRAVDDQRLQALLLSARPRESDNRNREIGAGNREAGTGKQEPATADPKSTGMDGELEDRSR